MVFFGAAALIQYDIYDVNYNIYYMHQLHLGPAAAACGRSELALLVSACLTIFFYHIYLARVSGLMTKRFLAFGHQPGMQQKMTETENE